LDIVYKSLWNTAVLQIGRCVRNILVWDDTYETYERDGVWDSGYFAKPAFRRQGPADKGYRFVGGRLCYR